MKYEDIVTLEHIEEAYKIIRKNTEHKKKLMLFDEYYMGNISHIYDELIHHKYHHGHYHIFLIREPKYRIIMSENLNDKIVNHLISKYVLQPLIYPLLVSSNVATRKNKGSEAAFHYLKFYINKLKRKGKVYVLKCDISKYFYHMDHQIILDKLRKLIVDDDIFLLIKDIIDSTDEEYVNQCIHKIIHQEKYKINKDSYLIKELDSIPYYELGKGLPIGNMSSQILALLYLNDMDHFIKEVLGIHYYIRYMDDFLLFSGNKEYLNICKDKIEKFLYHEKLVFNKKTSIWDMNKGIKFLGYHFVLNSNILEILPVYENKYRIRRHIKDLKENNIFKYYRSIISYHGYFMRCHI